MTFRTKIFAVIYVMMLLVIFILPEFSASGYSIVSNTTSELGAQKTANSWVMNGTFILLGVCTIYAGWMRYKGFLFHQVVLVIFGLALAFTGVFSHAPIDQSVQFSVKEDQWHSLFASITGFSFTLLAISTAFIQKKNKLKLMSIVLAIFAVLMSFLIFKFESSKGIWQRSLFIVTFAWMLYEFNKRPTDK